MNSNLLYDLTSSSIAAIFGVLITNPLDVIKTRYQINKNKNSSISKTVYQTIKTESIFTLWSGLTPAIIRAITYGGLRLGLYPFICENSNGVLNNFTSSLLSGALAAFLTNPIELIKVHVQTSNIKVSTIEQIKFFYKSFGIVGFWNGTLPAMQRAALLTAGQVGCYDTIRSYLADYTIFSNKSLLTISSAWIAGIATTTVTSPFDVLKVRRMKEGKSITLASILKSEGIQVIFKGWWPN